MESPYIVRDLPRFCSGAPCQCNGYADRTDDVPTQDEIKEYDCGRGYACCTAVFICRICGIRFIGTLDSPDNY